MGHPGSRAAAAGPRSLLLLWPSASPCWFSSVSGVLKVFRAAQGHRPFSVAASSAPSAPSGSPPSSSSSGHSACGHRQLPPLQGHRGCSCCCARPGRQLGASPGRGDRGGTGENKRLKRWLRAERA